MPWVQVKIKSFQRSFRGPEDAAETLARKLAAKLPRGSRAAVSGVVTDGVIQGGFSRHLRTAFDFHDAPVKKVLLNAADLERMRTAGALQGMGFFRTHRKEFNWLEADYLILGETSRRFLWLRDLHLDAAGVYVNEGYSVSVCFDPYWPLGSGCAGLIGLAVIWILARAVHEWYLSRR